MHEMSITQSVVEAVCTHAAGRRVLEVNLEVGTLTAVIPDAMRFCFDLATEGTVAEGAQLHIEMPRGARPLQDVRPGIRAARSRSCCARTAAARTSRVISGRQLQIVSMEVK